LPEKDFYALLGVSRTASEAEIKAAFRRIALQYHPDRNKDEGASAKFAEAREAYAVLSNDQKRPLYDALGPDKYDDPLEVFKYEIGRLIAERQGPIGPDGYGGDTAPVYQEENYAWEWIKTIIILLMVYLFWKMLP